MNIAVDNRSHAELADEIGELLDKMLVNANPKTSKLARQLKLAMLAVAIHGDGNVSQALAKRADDFLNRLNGRNREVKSGQRRRVWEFIVEQRAHGQASRRGETLWSKAGDKFKISASRAKGYYYAERKARIARGSPGDGRFPDDGQVQFVIDASG